MHSNLPAPLIMLWPETPSRAKKALNPLPRIPVENSVRAANRPTAAAPPPPAATIKGIGIPCASN